jgi:hypothetical protein
VRTLAHVSRADAQCGAFDLAAPKEFDRRRGLFRIAERVADVFDTAGDANTTAQMRSWMLTSLAVAQGCTRFLYTALQHWLRAHALWQRVARGFNTAFAVNV